MSDEEIIKRLDTLIAVMRLAYADQIDAARTKLLTDDVNKAILEVATGDFVASGDLKAKVAKSTKQSDKTVQRRILDLLAVGALEKRPTGLAAYRATGLI